MLDFFDQPFWQQFIVTFVGVIIGIPFALWINRRQAAREQANAKSADTAKARQVLQALKQSVQKNIGLLNQMLTDLKAMAIFYNVDLSVIQAFETQQAILIEDVALSEKLANLRYELSHLHRKVELQLQIEFDGSLRALNLGLNTPQGPQQINAYAKMRSDLVGAIFAHISPTLDACNDVLKEINRVDEQLAAALGGAK